jgi:sugar O-acyltransferase (sialic acid O-acetyltransferase NeuD family)
MEENVLVFGSSGHAKVIISIIEREKKYKIIGVIDPFMPVSEQVSNYPVLGGEENLDFICGQYNVKRGIIGIGDNLMRKKIYNKIISVKNDFEFITTIHPSAQIGNNVQIGYGTVIMPGAIINSNTTIGDFSIINTNASLDHDSKLGHFSSLAPGVVTGGFVTIGDYSSISIGAILKNNINIGKNSVIGAGSLVLKDIEDNVVAYGSPARKIRSNIPL